MMPRTLAIISSIGVLFLAAAGAFWKITLPTIVSAQSLPSHTTDLKNGETMFNIGGCASCHAIPNKDPDKVNRELLGGGMALKSPFGTFYVPNISPDPVDGIGAWTEANFVTALWRGTSEQSKHLYPALPYTSYQHMQLDDVRDLFAYIKTLPPVSGKAAPHDLAFPFNQRLFTQIWLVIHNSCGASAFQVDNATGSLIANKN